MPSLTTPFRQPGGSDAPSQAASLLDLFLDYAGFSRGSFGGARVEQTSPPTLEDKVPVRVLGHRGQFIHFRVQPDVDPPIVFTMRLSVPKHCGSAVEDVYRRLRRSTNAFLRHLRNQNTLPQETETVMTSEATPFTTPEETAHEDGCAARPNGEPTAAAASHPNALEFDTLTGVTRHPEKLRYVLTFVDQASKTSPGSAMAFKKALRKAAGWSDQPIRAVALVLAWLCKHDYVAKIRDDQDQVINYRLTPRGASLAFSGMGAASGPVADVLGNAQPLFDPMLADLDPGNLLIRFRIKAEELADAGKRLEANRDRYRQLQDELKRLDDEYNEIARILVTNREAAALLCRLLELQGLRA